MGCRMPSAGPRACQTRPSTTNHPRTPGTGKTASSDRHLPAWEVKGNKQLCCGGSPTCCGPTGPPAAPAPVPAGRSRIASSGHRLCWGFIYCTLLGTLAFQLYLASYRYLSGAISQHWEVQTLERIPVPAITICHGNMFKKEVVLRSTVAGTTWVDWIKYGPRLLRWGEVDYDTFFWNASYRWSDMVASCHIHSANCSSSGTFYETATHLSGVCTTFVSNMTVRRQHTGSQIQLTLMEESATGPHEHAGWQVFLHSADVRFTDVTMFTGFMDQVLVSSGRVICVDLTTVQASRIQGGCSARPNALIEYEQCVVDQLRININATTEGPCKLPWNRLEDTNRSCTSYRDYLVALAIPEDQLDEPDFLLWSAGHACRPPCNTQSFRKDAQQSLWLSETQLLLLQPQLVGRTAALLRLRLADGRERLAERQAYPLDAFVADVGGHLGLLLGGSVLALLQLGDQLARAAHRRLRGRSGPDGRALHPCQGAEAA